MLQALCLEADNYTIYPISGAEWWPCYNVISRRRVNIWNGPSNTECLLISTVQSENGQIKVISALDWKRGTRRRTTLHSSTLFIGSSESQDVCFKSV
jgi:hypothetical protein